MASRDIRQLYQDHATVVRSLSRLLAKPSGENISGKHGLRLVALLCSSPVSVLLSTRHVDKHLKGAPPLNACRTTNLALGYAEYEGIRCHSEQTLRMIRVTIPGVLCFART